MSPTIMVLTDSPHVPTTDSLTGNTCKITKNSRNGGRTGLQPGCRFTGVPLYQKKDIPSIKRTIIWIENLEEYKESWNKMIALNPRMVYPAHGKPFAAEDLKRFESHLEKIRMYPL